MPRIYVVTDGHASMAESSSLVEADSQSQAIGIVVGARYSAKAASSSDVAILMSAGKVVLRPKAKQLIAQLDLPGIV